MPQCPQSADAHADAVPVVRENYSQAAGIKRAMEILNKFGAQLCKLEQLKHVAVQKENFEVGVAATTRDLSYLSQCV